MQLGWALMVVTKTEMNCGIDTPTVTSKTLR